MEFDITNAVSDKVCDELRLIFQMGKDQLKTLSREAFVARPYARRDGGAVRCTAICYNLTQHLGKYEFTNGFSQSKELRDQLGRMKIIFDQHGHDSETTFLTKQQMLDLCKTNIIASTKFGS